MISLLLMMCAFILPTSITMAETDQEILDRLMASGYPPFTESGMLNLNIYKEYEVVSYGEPFGDVYGTYTADGETSENRYLGYNKSGNPITNDFFPSDFEPISDPRNRNYMKLGADSVKTWEDLDDFQKARILYEPFLNSDYGDGFMPYNLMEMLSNVAETESEVMEYAEVLVAPTSTISGVIRVWHISDNSISTTTYGGQ